MPAPSNKTITTRTMLESNSADASVKSDRARAAYDLLNGYSFVGSMMSHSWQCPTGKGFEFSPGASELYYGGVPFSALGGDDKRDFMIWLDKFVKRCIFNYNKNYGI